MLKTSIIAVCAVAALSVPATVQAHGGQPVVDTETVAESDTVPFSGPCSGSGVVAIEYHGTIHFTGFADGHSVFKFNQAGTFAFDPDDPGQLESSGHYRNGFTTVVTQNTFSDVSTFVVNGRDAAGERTAFKIRTAIVFANGELRVEIVDVDCG